MKKKSTATVRAALRKLEKRVLALEYHAYGQQSELDCLLAHMRGVLVALNIAPIQPADYRPDEDALGQEIT